VTLAYWIAQGDLEFGHGKILANSHVITRKTALILAIFAFMVMRVGRKSLFPKDKFNSRNRKRTTPPEELKSIFLAIIIAEI
jgi:hypothetical protein